MQGETKTCSSISTFVPLSHRRIGLSNHVLVTTMPYVEIGLGPPGYCANSPRLAGDGRRPSPEGCLTEPARQV